MDTPDRSSRESKDWWQAAVQSMLPDHTPVPRVLRPPTRWRHHVRWALRKTPLRPPLALVLGFAALIAVGTLALLLPQSARAARADPLTAFFTATSAVCVTGLTTVDTGTYWSPFGQGVIAALMEIGGLGFMVGVAAVRLFFHGRISLQQRIALQDSGAASQLGGEGGLIGRTLAFTAGCELIGAALLWARFAPRFGSRYGLWLAIFHAVSAFTNGSFDLFGDYRSLATFEGDPVVLLTVAALIVVGGLGIIVVSDLYRARSWRRLTLDSKAVLLGTAVLLCGGAAVLFVTERRNPASLGGRPVGTQLVLALFHSAAARTAGFSTWNFAHADQRTLFFLLGPMLIGGAPGSMAGGIKVTTAAVLLACVWSTLRGRPETTLLQRRVPTREIAQALAVAALAVLLIANVALAISEIEGPHLTAPFLDLVFETTSAFGTVGFSTGLTPHLSTPSQLLIALTMFVGRLGPVTAALALTARRPAAAYRRPSESLRIG